MKIKSKKPNIFWHFIDSDDFLRTSTLPLIYVDFFISKHERHNNRRKDDTRELHFGNLFSYSFKEFTIRLGSSLFGKSILDVSVISNQHEYLKYLHQEWDGAKTFIKGAILK